VPPISGILPLFACIGSPASRACPGSGRLAVLASSLNRRHCPGCSPTPTTALQSRATAGQLGNRPLLIGPRDRPFHGRDLTPPGSVHCSRFSPRIMAGASGPIIQPCLTRDLTRHVKFGPFSPTARRLAPGDSNGNAYLGSVGNTPGASSRGFAVADVSKSLFAVAVQRGRQDGRQPPATGRQSIGCGMRHPGKMITRSANPGCKGRSPRLRSAPTVVTTLATRRVTT